MVSVAVPPQCGQLITEISMTSDGAIPIKEGGGRMSRTRHDDLAYCRSAFPKHQPTGHDLDFGIRVNRQGVLDRRDEAILEVP